MPVKKKARKKPAKQAAAPRKAATRKKAAKTNGSGRWMQQSIPRKEDGRLIRGQGKFVDDYKFPGMLHLFLLRSPYGHARINSIDTSEAETAPGVVCVLTGEEIAKQVQPFLEIGPDPGAKIIDYPMAVGRARYQGEPVAAVVAETRMQAQDAAELIQVDYDVLPAVVDTEEALTDKTILHESSGTNLVWPV
jgi:2-furoyl-CoA dehydrogenase large subunit